MPAGVLTSTTDNSLGNRLRVFSSNGTFVVPAGVFYIFVRACGGGAGATSANSGTAGANTTVVATSGTVTGPGMASNPTQTARSTSRFGNATANSGDAGRREALGETSTSDGGQAHEDNKGFFVSGGLSVAPGESVAVTIGAGGSGTGNGGSGVATIYWEV